MRNLGLMGGSNRRPHERLQIMSGEILFDVMNCDGFGKPAMKLLLIALADRADEAGVCWPSRADLVLRTGMSQSAITRTARALESAEWIQRKQRRDASSLYRLNVVKISRCAAQCKAERRLRRAGGEWEPFPEEKAQAIENIGDGQNDHTSVHSEPTNGHSGHLTSQEPLKKTKARKRANRASGPGRSPAPVARPLGGGSGAAARFILPPAVMYAYLNEAKPGESREAFAARWSEGSAAQARDASARSGLEKVGSCDV